MSQKNNDDNHDLKPKDVIYTLAIALNIEAQSKAVPQQLANQLHTNRHVYYAYSVLDSLSSSYSMFKYFFDVCLGGTADDMHHAMLTPLGIVAITIETGFLVGFSFLACHFDGKKDDNKTTANSPADIINDTDAKKRVEQRHVNTKHIVVAWGYFRDILKGLKNAYKGWRSAIIALGLLSTTNLSMFILPVGLFLGVVAAGNRYLMRSIREERKKMKKNNDITLSTLIKFSSLRPESIQQQLIETPIQYQTDNERYIGFLSSAIAGFIDGLYLYVGVLTLVTLAPQLLIAMASLSVFYISACIVTRIYEEYDYQLDLMITQTECDFVLVTKQLKTCYADLLSLQIKPNHSEEEQQKLRGIKDNLCKFIDQFEGKRHLLQRQRRPTWGIAVLVGIKNGLHAYGVLSSVLFLAASLLSSAGVALSVLALAIVVSSGLVFIVGFIAHALSVNSAYHKEHPSDDNLNDYQVLLNLKNQLKEPSNNTPLLTIEVLVKSLKEGLSVKSVSRFYFQEWSEVFRSFFSGAGKGQKFIDFAGNPFQEHGADGHYHDTPLMHRLGTLSALLFAFILALRALARGFGRSSSGGDSDLSTAADQKVKNNDVAEEPIASESIEQIPLQTADPRAGSVSPRSNSSSLFSRFGFFAENKPFSPGLVSTEGAIDDCSVATSPYKV